MPTTSWRGPRPRVAGEGLMPDLLVLSVRQPWATAIMLLGKDVENRSWSPSSQIQPGARLGIHASKVEDRWASQRCLFGVDVAGMPRGALLGCVTFTGAHHSSTCVARPCSEWAQADQWHWQLADPRPLTPVEVPRGQLGLWRHPFPQAWTEELA